MQLPDRKRLLSNPGPLQQAPLARLAEVMALAKRERLFGQGHALVDQAMLVSKRQDIDFFRQARVDASP